MTFTATLSTKVFGGLKWKPEEHEAWRSFLQEHDGEEVTITQEQKSKGTRSSQQNRALHLWLGQLAKALQDKGVTLQDVVKEIRKTEIQPTMENLKEVVWRPMQLALTAKESSTQLTKPEVTAVFDAINLFLAHRFEIHVPFPSHELGYWDSAPLKDV